MRHVMNIPSAAEIAEGVRQFNATFGEMERALWCLSKAARADLLQRQSSPILEGLVWTIKGWWGVQGVRLEIKSIMAQALNMNQWTPELFEDSSDLVPEAERFACDQVVGLVTVSTKLGAQRYEISLASKVLHWLMPWRIPVYDSFVRRGAGIPTSMAPLNAYQLIVASEFDAARRLSSEGSDWIGNIQPRSPFRALDKYMWWISGGNSGRALAVRDPWRIVRQLGLRPNLVGS